MAYIDRVYYYSQFMGKDIPADEFDQLARIASDVINSLVTVNLDESNISDDVKKATAYQAEMLYHNGGVDAVVGFASGSISSESLGDYSVSYSGDSKFTARTKDGIPVSSLSISILKNAGLMSRWAYSERYKKILGKI